MQTLRLVPTPLSLLPPSLSPAWSVGDQSWELGHPAWASSIFTLCRHFWKCVVSKVKEI